MGPTSVLVMVLLATAITGLAAATASRRRHGGRPARGRDAALLVLGQVLLAALVVAPAPPPSARASRPDIHLWAARRVAGTHPATAHPVLGTGGPGSLDAALAALRRSRHLTGSVVTDITVPGRRTGYRWPARVYLPAQYFSATDARRTFPVVELIAGSHSRPGSIFGSIPLQKSFDTAIARHTLPPVIGIAPTRNPVPMPDRQCIDEPHGHAVATYLGVDVPRSVPHLLRARTDRAGWATMGTSSGGYCAADLALRNPTRFSTVVSLSGYFSGPIDNVRQGMVDPSPTPAERLANTPIHQVRKVTQPMSFVLVSARDDTEEYRELMRFAAVVRTLPSDGVSTIVTPSGGHSSAAWRPVMSQILGGLGRCLTG
ncbi:MAG TPA: alpha/beta hydrolase-fold protein [Mycobacteriales bacterium]|nr:alpha/beta hydrolase-fold protein [Mycobacteriales bacterium]